MTRVGVLHLCKLRWCGWLLLWIYLEIHQITNIIIVLCLIRFATYLCVIVRMQQFDMLYTWKTLRYSYASIMTWVTLNFESFEPLSRVRCNDSMTGNCCTWWWRNKMQTLYLMLLNERFYLKHGIRVDRIWKSKITETICARKYWFIGIY